MQFRIVDLHASGNLDVACGQFTFALLAQVGHDGLVVLRRDGELLDVQDDLSDVLGHAGNGAELVQYAINADAGNSGAGDGGQQSTAEGVTHGVAETGLQRLDGEARAVGRYDLFSQSGALCNKHFVSFR